MATSPPHALRRAARELSNGYRAVAGKGMDFIHQPLGERIDPNGLGGYYCDLRHKALLAIDELPPADGGDRDGEWWVIPVAQSALGFWELRMEGRAVDAQFLQLADWLLARAEPEPAGGVVWRRNRPQSKYGLAPGWASAMGQGEAASVLLRAHELTGREAYLQTARAAFPPLTLPVAEGGLHNVLDGALVLEEYPTREPTAILNGWIFALFGVHELAIAADMPEARELFDRSYEGLLQLLPRYDVGWWSLYSLGDHGADDLAKPFYQRLHPVMLDALAVIRPDPLLTAYAERWRRQLTRRATTRAAVDKVVFRVRRSIVARASRRSRTRPPRRSRT